MRRRLGLMLLALALAVSGCSSDARPAASQSMAPEASVGSGTGSIVGIVFDPELSPVAGANVTLQGRAPIRSDASGAFTFNGLSPGIYVLRFAHAAFENVDRKAEVTSGEVTQIRVELQPGVINGAYQWSFSKVGLVRLGQWSLQYAQHAVNNSAVDAVFCDPCSYPVTLRPSISDALTEAQYERAVNMPYINEYVTVAYTVAQTTGGSLKLLMTHDFPPHESYRWSSVQVRELRGYENVRLEFHGPDTATPGLLVNQKIEVWQTFAQGKPLPEGYTLLPD